MSTDRNFDDLLSKFKRNIYSTLKGQIRLAVLQRDLAFLASGQPLSVLDAGGGLGNLSRWFAQSGHRVLLTDISDEMLCYAQDKAKQQALADFSTLKLPLQSLSELNTHYDLVINHAVLEWVTEQEYCLQQLVDRVAPGGYLSLMVFNHHGLLFHNLTAGNLVHVANGMKTRKKKLVPSHPLAQEQVEQWLTRMGMQPVLVSGVRVFNDYIRDQRDQLTDQQIIDMELKQSREKALIPVSRYLHLLYQKPTLHS